MRRREAIQAAGLAFATPFVGSAAATPTVEVRVYVTERVWQRYGWTPAKNVVTYAREMLGWDGYELDIGPNYHLFEPEKDGLWTVLNEWRNKTTWASTDWATAKDSMLLVTNLADEDDAVWGYGSTPDDIQHPHAVIGGAGHLAALDAYADRGDWYDYDHRFMNSAVHEILHNLGYEHAQGSITANDADTELYFSPLAHGQYDADLCVNDHPLENPERWYADHTLSRCVRDTDPTVA